MAKLTGAYDPNAEASKPRDPLPTGEYLAMITDSEWKATKKNDGEYLELTYDIIDGACKGRKLWVRLNLKNANAEAVEIANRDLSAIRQATGVLNPDDSVELHNKPHIIRVEFIAAGTTKGKKRYDQDTNEVRAYKKLDGVAPAPVAAAPVSAPASGVKPWGQRAA